MNTKKKQQNFNSLSIKNLKKCLKTELAIIYLTSDGKSFFNENLAIIHECSLDQTRTRERRWDKMKTKIAEIVCQILKEKQWGIFFKNEPMQSLPVQDNTSLYKINEVNDDELIDAIKLAMEERMNEWQNHQAEEEQNQTDKGLSTGTNQTLLDTD